MTNNNGGLPQQQIPGGPIRQESVNLQNAGINKQLNLINPSGGKRRKTRNLRKTRIQNRRKTRGGAGSSGNSSSPISPPIVPNTGSTVVARDGQQSSYNNLASLSGSVNANSVYDGKGGKRKRKRKSQSKNKSRKTRKH